MACSSSIPVRGVSGKSARVCGRYCRHHRVLQISALFRGIGSEVRDRTKRCVRSKEQARKVKEKKENRRVLCRRVEVTKHTDNDNYRTWRATWQPPLPVLPSSLTCLLLLLYFLFSILYSTLLLYSSYFSTSSPYSSFSFLSPIKCGTALIGYGEKFTGRDLPRLPRNRSARGSLPRQSSILCFATIGIRFATLILTRLSL